MRSRVMFRTAMGGAIALFLLLVSIAVVRYNGEVAAEKKLAQLRLNETALNEIRELLVHPEEVELISCESTSTFPMNFEKTIRFRMSATGSSLMGRKDLFQSYLKMVSDGRAARRWEYQQGDSRIEIVYDKTNAVFNLRTSF
ncbi:MAG: hypothetical protein ABL949_07135 [Fimbriimonadaceae bacterium]